MRASENLTIGYEAVAQISEFTYSAADTLPEYNYWILSCATVLGPALLSELRHVPTAFPYIETIAPAWNYVDGSCAVAVGLMQLTDNYHHRPLVNKLKGLLNCASGAHVITLSALNFAALGGPAFAMAGGIGFAISLEETMRRGRRKHDVDYWVKDSLAELDKINSVILPDLKKQIAELEKIPAQQNGHVSRWALKRKTARLNKYLEQKTEIEQALAHRLALRQHSSEDTELTPEQRAQYAKELKSIETRLNPEADEVKKYDSATIAFLKKLKTDPEPFDITRSQQKEQEIIKQNANDFRDASCNSFIWGVAFIGMLCLCFPIPGAQIAGFALIGLASALYLAKHGQQIAQGVTQLKNRFFNPRTAETTYSQVDPENVQLGKPADQDTDGASTGSRTDTDQGSDDGLLDDQQPAASSPST